ncbi:MAG: hypothetical protein P8J20_15965, partial [Novosphingobium sp.]|nr:hypothetical protein [Novosphingobium sp.]
MIAGTGKQAIARSAGWLLVGASAVFLVIVARRHWAGISEIALAPGQWLAVAGLSVLYGLSLLLLAAAWHWVLVFVAAGPPDRAHSLRAYTSSQLAKYVPGNVFHLVGRHMIHRAAGMPNKRLALATLVEVLLMLAAALSVVAVSLLADMPPVLEPWSGVVVTGLFALVF